MNIGPVEAELFYADGQTDMTKLIADFHNSANVTNKEHRRPQLGITVAKDRFVLCAFRRLTTRSTDL